MCGEKEKGMQVKYGKQGIIVFSIFRANYSVSTSGRDLIITFLFLTEIVGKEEQRKVSTQHITHDSRQSMSPIEIWLLSSPFNNLTFLSLSLSHISFSFSFLYFCNY